MKLRRLTETLLNKTIVITGASRGIGKEIASRCALDGANIVLVARSHDKPSHNKLEGSLAETKKIVEKNGGTAMILPLDIGKEDLCKHVDKVISNFGCVDCVINNASAIDINKVCNLNKFDMMMNVNARGTMNTIQAFYNSLEYSDLKHVLSISPPLSTLHSKWLVPHPPYTTSKYAMSMITLGYSDVFRANTLWPKKLIKTAATRMLESQTTIPAYSKGLHPSAFADVVHEIICSDVSNFSGLDDDIKEVCEEGVDDIFIYTFENHKLI